MAHFFTKINGLEVNDNRDDFDAYYDPTLHISGGHTNNKGEYSRPLALHGKDIQMYAMDGSKINQNESNQFLLTTDANIQISTDKANIQLGSTHLNLFRDNAKEPNNLTTVNDLKINVGQEVANEYEVEEVNISNNENQEN